MHPFYSKYIEGLESEEKKPELKGKSKREELVAAAQSAGGYQEEDDKEAA